MQSRLLISICPTKIVFINYCWNIMYAEKPGEYLLSVEKKKKIIARVCNC